MMDTPVDFGLHTTFVALYAGTIIMSTTYGAVTVQAYKYFRSFPNDRVLIRVLVGVLWILDTGHTVATAHGIYRCFNMVMIGSIEDLLVDRPPIGFALLFAFTVVNGACVRGFYIYRIWKLSDKNYILATVLFIFLLYTAAISSVLSVQGFMLPSFYKITTMRTLIYLALGSVTLMDWSLCIFLSGLLLRKKPHSKRTRSLIHSVILYSVTSGLLTSILSLGVLFCFIFGTAIIWIGPWILFDKSYLLACYTTLNSRKSFRDDDLVQVDVVLTGAWAHESDCEVQSQIQFAGGELESKTFSCP
ncbi:hypothetical protein DENSPDRAFT_669955 [Dentipellis sp. KUC8613]|nr:hypothetical protein DENSPDRAFT_669955 [Dentipellis sp. KUC8613]